MRGYWGLLAAGAMVAISASSCGRPNKLDLGAFEPYVTAYERESAKRGDPIVAIDLVIQFGQMEAAGQRGLCSIRGGDTPVITVEKAYWDRVDEMARGILMFHELGHCLSRRNHDTARDPESGLPDSIMYPYLLTKDQFLARQEKYLAELYSIRNEF
jgi:hypothetical protein